MRKIDQLKDLLNNSTLSFAEKVESLNSNQLDLSIFLLLSNKKDEFKAIFPVKDVSHDLSWFSDYLDSEINSLLFEELVKNQDFVFNLLKDVSLFKDINELSSNVFYMRVAETLENSDTEPLLSLILHNDLLKNILDLSLFDSRFISSDEITDDELIIINDFIKLNPQFFTERYFDSLERGISKQVAGSLAESILPLYLQDSDKKISDYQNKFFPQEPFECLQFLENNFTKLKLNDFKQIFEFIINSHKEISLNEIKEFQIIESIKSNIGAVLSDSFQDSEANNRLLFFTYYSFFNNMEYSKEYFQVVYMMLGRGFLEKQVDEFKNNRNRYGYDSTLSNFLEEKQDEDFLKNKEFNKLSSIERINQLSLNKNEKMDIIISFIEYHVESNEYISAYGLSNIDDIDLLKNEIALEIIKRHPENSNKFEDYFDYIKEYLTEEQMFSLYPVRFIEDLVSSIDSSSNDNVLKYLSKETKPLFKKQILLELKKGHSYGKEKLVFFAINNNMFSQKEIIKLIETDKVNISYNLLKNLDIDQIKALYKSKKISKYELLQFTPDDNKAIDKYVMSLERSDFIHYYKNWIGLNLSESNLNFIYNQIKHENNRDIKDTLFSMYKNHINIMSADLKETIHKRCSKLKGFEDILLLVNNSDDSIDDSSSANDILEKKFTKEIQNENHIHLVLNKVDFYPIFSIKNIKRALGKISSVKKMVSIIFDESFSEAQKYLNFDTIDFLIQKNPSLLIFMLSSDLLTMSEKDSLYLKYKDDFIKNTNDFYGYDKIYFDIDFKYIHNLSKASLDTRVFRLLSEEQVDLFLESDYWTKVLYKTYNGDKDLNEFFNDFNLLITQEQDLDLISKVISDVLRRNSDNYSSENLLFLQKYCPQKIMNLADSYQRDSSFANSEAIITFFSICPIGAYNINYLLEKKNLFSKEEYENILRALTHKQISEYFQSLISWHSRRGNFEIYSRLTDAELRILINEENKDLIPSQFWTVAMLLSNPSLSEEDFSNFMGSLQNVKNIYLMNSEEKSKFYSLLLKYSLSEEIYHFVISHKDVLNLNYEQLEQLFYKISPENISKIARKFNSFKDTFIQFSPKFKEDFFKILESGENQRISLTDFIKLSSKENNQRLKIIQNCTSVEEIRECLGVDDLSFEELDVITNIIIQNKMIIPSLKYFKTEYIEHIMNQCVDQDFFILEDLDHSIVINAHIEVAKLNENEQYFIKILSTENKAKLLKIYQSIISLYPEQIEGSFDVINKKFIPNQPVAENILDLIPSESMSDSFFNNLDTKAQNILKSLIKFKAIASIKTKAIRQGKYYSNTSNSSKISYKLEFNIDHELMTNCSNFYNKDLKSELDKKTQDLEKFLNLNLIPSDDRKFGFELEASFNKDKNAMVKKFRSSSDVSHGFAVTNEYRSSSGKVWDFKEDGSVKNVSGFAAEIASPILKGIDGINEARSFLQFLFNNFEVRAGEDTSGGLHVHHDIQDILKIKEESSEILKEFFKFQESIFALCDTWRQDNHWCSRINFNDLEDGKDLSGKRIGFNLSAYKTMEFRMRENLSDSESIIRWILLTQKVVESVALQIQGHKKEFVKSANQALDLIEKEKLLQLKKQSTNNDELSIMTVLNEFKNAQLFSKMLIYHS